MPVHAFIFPGQGSQFAGMGRDLAAAFAPAREVFQEGVEARGEQLSQLMLSGAAEELTLTENAQPALMAVSLAVLRVLEREGGWRLADRATLVAGHSLGEYSALAAAGSLGIAETARLLRLRGNAMQKAVPAGEGGMAALLGVELEQAHAICAADGPQTQRADRAAGDGARRARIGLVRAGGGADHPGGDRRGRARRRSPARGGGRPRRRWARRWSGPRSCRPAFRWSATSRRPR